MKIDRLDHLVLTVADIDHTCRFYTSVLGMEAVTFGEGRRALVFGRQKINLHRQGHEYEPKARHPLPGSSDLCFVTTTPIDQVVHHLAEHRIDIIEGPVTRTGALGPMTSIYLRDPDQNLIELSNYPDQR